MPVQGVQRVINNYRLKVGEISGARTEAGVYAVLSQGGAMAQTMVPMDTSTMLNSQYAPQIAQEGGKTVGHLGYTAAYAPWVHEAPGTLAGQPRANGNGDYWDPAGEPGFLVKGFDQITGRVMDILKATYRAK